MSRKMGLIFTGAFIVGMTLYMGYDAKISGLYDLTFSEFIKIYLDSSQKYFFNITIFLIPISYFGRIPFLKSEYFIRLRDDMPIYIIKRTALTSLLTTALISMSFILTAFVFGINISQLAANIPVIIKLFLFINAGLLVGVSIYFLTNKIILGIMSIAIINFLFLMTLIAYQYYTMTWDNNLEKNLFYAYIVIANCLPAIYLFARASHKECLK